MKHLFKITDHPLFLFIFVFFFCLYVTDLEQHCHYVRKIVAIPYSLGFPLVMRGNCPQFQVCRILSL